MDSSLIEDIIFVESLFNKDRLALTAASAEDSLRNSEEEDITETVEYTNIEVLNSEFINGIPEPANEEIVFTASEDNETLPNGNHREDQPETEVLPDSSLVDPTPFIDDSEQLKNEFSEFLIFNKKKNNALNVVSKDSTFKDSNTDTEGLVIFELFIFYMFHNYDCDLFLLIEFFFGFYYVNVEKCITAYPVLNIFI